MALAGGHGETVGFISPIERGTGKTPFPCAIAWSNAQMYEITDDVQQCVKVTVETKEEYFFTMTSELGNASRLNPFCFLLVIYVYNLRKSTYRK